MIRVFIQAAYAHGRFAALDGSRVAATRRASTSGELDRCGDRKKREGEQSSGGELHVWSTEAVVERLQWAVRLKKGLYLLSPLYLSICGSGSLFVCLLLPRFLSISHRLSWVANQTMLPFVGMSGMYDRSMVYRKCIAANTAHIHP